MPCQSWWNMLNCDAAHLHVGDVVVIAVAVQRGQEGRHPAVHHQLIQHLQRRHGAVNLVDGR